MRLYAIHSRLQEPTVWATVVFIFYLEVCLRTEFLLDTLAVFDDTVNAQLQVFQLKRLRDIGIYADAIGLHAFFFLYLCRQHHKGKHC